MKCHYPHDDQSLPEFSMAMGVLEVYVIMSAL